MALHQPVMAHHHLPRWVGWAGAAMIAIALVAGVALVIVNTGVFTSVAPATSQRLVVQGAGGGLEYTGIPWRTGRAPGIAVQTADGGILYTGIPYPTGTARGLAVQTADGGILYTGVPYPTGIARGISVQTADGGILYVGIPYPPPSTTQ